MVDLSYKVSIAGGFLIEGLLHFLSICSDSLVNSSYEAGLATINFLKASRISGRFLSVSANGLTDALDPHVINGPAM